MTMRHVPCKKLRVQVCNAELQRQDGSIIECGQDHVRDAEFAQAAIDSHKERRAEEWLHYLLEAVNEVVENHDEDVSVRTSFAARRAIDKLKRVGIEYHLSEHRRAHPTQPPDDWRTTVHDAVMEGRMQDALSILLSCGVKFDAAAGTAYGIRLMPDGTFFVDVRMHPDVKALLGPPDAQS